MSAHDIAEQEFRKCIPEGVQVEFYHPDTVWPSTPNITFAMGPTRDDSKRLAVIIAWTDEDTDEGIAASAQFSAHAFMDEVRAMMGSA